MHLLSKFEYIEACVHARLYYQGRDLAGLASAAARSNIARKMSTAKRAEKRLPHNHPLRRCFPCVVTVERTVSPARDSCGEQTATGRMVACLRADSCDRTPVPFVFAVDVCLHCSRNSAANISVWPLKQCGFRDISGPRRKPTHDALTVLTQNPRCPTLGACVKRRSRHVSRQSKDATWPHRKHTGFR